MAASTATLTPKEKAKRARQAQTTITMAAICTGGSTSSDDVRAEESITKSKQKRAMQRANAILPAIGEEVEELLPSLTPPNLVLRDNQSLPVGDGLSSPLINIGDRGGYDFSVFLAHWYH